MDSDNIYFRVYNEIIIETKNLSKFVVTMSASIVEVYPGTRITLTNGNRKKILSESIHNVLIRNVESFLRLLNFNIDAKMKDLNTNWQYVIVTTKPMRDQLERDVIQASPLRAHLKEAGRQSTEFVKFITEKRKDIRTFIKTFKNLLKVKEVDPAEIAMLNKILKMAEEIDQSLEISGMSVQFVDNFISLLIHVISPCFIEQKSHTCDAPPSDMMTDIDHITSAVEVAKAKISATIQVITDRQTSCV
jgi:uncharacterized protein YlzI (FlbEa/FlbD family)